MVDPPNEQELQLRQWLRVLRRRWVALAVVLVLGLGTALLYLAVRSPVYRAEAQVAVATVGDSSSQFAIDVAGLAELARSIEVSQRAEQELGKRVVPTITPRGADVLTVQVEASDPGLAADAANTYADVLVAVRTEAVQAQLAEAAEQLQGRIGDVDAQLAGEPEGSPVIGQLSEERAAYADALSSLRVKSALALLEGERVISRASAAEAAAEVSAAQVLLLALVLSGLLGVGAVTVVEYADDRVRRHGTDPLGGGAPVLATLPREARTRHPLLRPVALPEEPRPSRPSLALLEAPAGPTAEAFRALRARLFAAGTGDVPQVVLVTSAARGDDARAVATNLAIAVARSGRETVLIDVDYRRPDRLARSLTDDVDDDQPGLAAVLTGDTSLDDVMAKFEGVDDLAVVPAGHLEPGSAGDVLAGERAVEVVSELCLRDEVVLLVAPPVLRASETAQLSVLVDATLLVVRAGATRRRDVTAATERLAEVGAERVGAVLLTR